MSWSHAEALFRKIGGGVDQEVGEGREDLGAAEATRADISCL